MIVNILKKIVARLPFRTITGNDGRPYLTRWYVWPRGPRTAHGEDPATPPAPFAIFIHYFHRSDEDRELHNHPWGRSIAIILSGGYVEERDAEVYVVNDKVTYVERRTKTFRAGDVNVITKDDYHRVDLLYPDKGSWSLFIAGRNVGSWGFRDATTGKHIPWREYTNAGKTS